MCADLHIHTTFSDSSLTPQEVVEAALQAKLSIIAVTDHDTLDGVQPTQTMASKHQLEVISGIELTTYLGKKEVHLLGYGLSLNCDAFNEVLMKIKQRRYERACDIIQKLHDLGMTKILLDDIQAALPKECCVGRVHIAKAMLEHGYIKNIPQAFYHYLGDTKPAFVPKYLLPIGEAIALMKKAGGLSVLAHPQTTRVDECIAQLVDDGLQGLEVYHPSHTTATTAFYKKMARKYKLLITGGSDAHGQWKPETWIGKCTMPQDETFRMLAALKNFNE